MYTRAFSWLTKLPTTRKIEIGLYAFVVLVCVSTTLSVWILDRASIAPEAADALPYPVVHSDSEAYGQLAVRMLEHGVYSTDTEPPYTPEINWAPGYPLLIALSLALFGSTIPLVILQIALASLTAVLMFRVLTRFVPPYIALIPPLIFGADLSIAYYTSTVHTDGLFMSLITILVYALFVHDPGPTRRLTFFLLGILLGASALIRTIAQYLIVVLPLMYIAMCIVDKRSLTIGIRNMLIMVIGALLAITPWLVRNHEILGNYTLGNIGHKMFLQYYVKDFLTVTRSSETDGDFAQSDTAAAVSEEITAALRARVATDGGSMESHYGSVALEYIFNDPIRYSAFHTVGSLPYFLAGSYRHFFVSTLDVYRARAGEVLPPHENIAHRMTAALFSRDMSVMWDAIASLSFVLLEVFWRIALVLFGVTALTVPNRRHRLLFALFWGLILYFALLTGPAALTRYRIVTEPLLLILAGIGAWRAYTYLRMRYVSNRVQ